MIELLPNLPMPGAPPGAATRAPEQADFSQWLAPSAQSPVPGAAAAPVLPVAVDTLIVPPALIREVLPVPMPPSTMPADAAFPDVPTMSPAAIGTPLDPIIDDAARLSWTLSGSEPGGAVQLIASPWRLAPGDRLSQELRATLSVHIDEPSATSSSSRLLATTAPAAGAGMIHALVATGSARSAADPVSPLPLQTVPHAASITSSDESAASRSAAGAQASQWPLRLLRWLNDSEGGATLWLRDFTTDPGASSGLVDDLRRFAQTEGLPLRRIVLNGHTLWAADPSLRDST